MSDPVCIVNVPGPKGDKGNNGTNGTNGVNAFTTLGAPFTMPDVDSNVTVTVADSRWMVPKQFVFIQVAGHFQVISVPTDTTVELKNLGYIDNAGPGSNINPGVLIPPLLKVSPSGQKGLDGSTGAGAPTDATYITKTAHGGLSAETTLSGLSTGYLKVAAGTGDLSSQAPPIPISDGGSNATTALAAFNNFAPTTARGDLITRDASNNVRLPIGAANTVLRSNATDPLWGQVNLATDVTGVLPIANGGSAQSSLSTVLTDGPTIFLDSSLSKYYEVELAGNRTFDFTNHLKGRVFYLKVKQDAVGTRSVTWDVDIVWPAATPPTLTVTPSHSDLFRFVDDGTKYLGSIVALDYIA